jgi:protein-disulfide isomerase
VHAGLERARQDGTERTPTFFISGRHYRGDSDRESLARAFSEELGK